MRHPTRSVCSSAARASAWRPSPANPIRRFRVELSLPQSLPAVARHELVSRRAVVASDCSASFAQSVCRALRQTRLVAPVAKSIAEARFPRRPAVRPDHVDQMSRGQASMLARSSGRMEMTRCFGLGVFPRRLSARLFLLLVSVKWSHYSRSMCLPSFTASQRAPRCRIGVVRLAGEPDLGLGRGYVGYGPLADIHYTKQPACHASMEEPRFSQVIFALSIRTSNACLVSTPADQLP